MATTECDRFHLSLLTWLQSFEHGCSFLFWKRLNSVVSATLLWQYRVRLQNGVEEDFWRFIYLTVYACWYLQARVKEQLNSCKPGRTKTTKKKSTRTVLGEKSQPQTHTHKHTYTNSNRMGSNGVRSERCCLTWKSTLRDMTIMHTHTLTYTQINSQLLRPQANHLEKKSTHRHIQHTWHHWSPIYRYHTCAGRSWLLG